MASTPKSENDWKAEGDAHSVAEAATIQSDPKRLAAARTAAKRMQVDEKKRAAEAVLRSNALSNLASGNTKKTSTPKASAKPKAKPKPKAKAKAKAKVVTKKKPITKAKPKAKAKPRAATPSRPAKRKK